MESVENSFMKHVHDIIEFFMKIMNSYDQMKVG